MSASRLYQKDSLMSGIPNKVVSDKPVFSLHHPMVPKRYVPEWQMDMKNRKLIAMVIKKLSYQCQCYFFPKTVELHHGKQQVTQRTCELLSLWER